MIPKTIHQIWLGETGEAEPPSRFRASAATWRDQNPSWEYRLWSGEDVRELFSQRRPDLLPLYVGYPRWVQRADAARYLILHELGGVYADLDIECTAPLDRLVDAAVVLAPTAPAGVSNDLMAAAPGNPFFRDRLDELPRAARRWDRAWVPPHFRVMCSTGSLFLTAGLKNRPSIEGLRLLTADEYGHGSPDRSLFHHLEGNSWAGWDTHALLFLQRQWKLIVGGALAAATAWIALT